MDRNGSLERNALETESKRDESRHRLQRWRGLIWRHRRERSMRLILLIFVPGEMHALGDKLIQSNFVI